MSKIGKIFLWVVLLVVLISLVFLVVFFQLSRPRISLNENYQTGMMYGRNTGIGSGSSDSFGLTTAELSVKTVDSATPQIANKGGDVKNNDRLIIKTGSMSLVVANVKSAVEQVVKYAEGNGGFVVYSNIYKSGLSPYGEVTVRIPAKVFDAGFAEVKKFGEVKSESVNGQDVTEEYTDLDAQLKNLRASESQFLEIMNRATRIEDVLAVQRELTVVRGQIEGIQGRMKYLSQSAEMSTLTVYLSTDPNVLPTVDQENKWKPAAQFKSATRSLVEFAKAFVNVLIWFVVYIPLWLLIVLVAWLAHRWWKRSKNNNV